MPLPDNLLFYGDNLDVLRHHIAESSVDLVYLDPPFNSDRNYNVLFVEQDGSRSAAQIRAFEDTWRWDQGAEAAYTEIVEAGGSTSQAMQAFRTFLGSNNMMAYLAMMAPRLIELRAALRDTGSIYLHCDPTASHYLKMLMDSVFGPENFQNEIIWYYKGAGISPRRWGRRHDTLLWYSKTDEFFFDPDPVRDEYAESTRERFSHYIGNVRDGHDFGVQELNPKGKHPDDVWQIKIVAPSARARLGYPTQKPDELLERILLSSSREGDTVLDPFCGCGTTVEVAQRLKRRWIGIDITQLSVTLVRHRLKTAFGSTATYIVKGEPVNEEEAVVLARDDPYQFQLWALGLVGARPAAIKKGADRGIDGRLFFHDEGEGGKTKQIVLSVKGGHLKSEYVRELPGIAKRENAEIAVLISLNKPSRPMQSEAAAAGFYTSPWGKHPRVQLLTVGDLLGGKRIDYPQTAGVNRTYKQAPKAKKVAEKVRGLFDKDEPAE